VRTVGQSHRLPLPRSRGIEPEIRFMYDLPLIVFDVNETLLDLETIAPTFGRIVHDKSEMRLWFANFIMYSAALTVAGQYVPFTDIGPAVMKMLADTQGIKIVDADKEESKEKFSTMPPHREAPAALRKLRDTGFRLFTLTDSLLEVQTRQLEHLQCGRREAPQTVAPGIAYIEKELRVKPTQLCLIACHTWDTLGTVAAGWESRADQARWQRRSGGRSSAANRRYRPQ
jgi:2-haloacid dehalogenase